MAATHCFNFNFLGTDCRVEISSDHPEAATKLVQFQGLFPVFTGATDAVPELTVVIHDVDALTPAGGPTDELAGQLGDYVASNYEGVNPAILKSVCNTRYLGSAHAQELARVALADQRHCGISVQKDFLVFSNRSAGRLEAIADVTASVEEAWGFHVLNFFKVFFFAKDVIRLHGSGALLDDKCLLLLANTGGGKSTMKNFFLEAVSGPEAFTDDSIMARRTATGFELYQDPVEFLRWCYMPADQLAGQSIPEPSAPVLTPPALFYLTHGETTSFSTCAPAQVLKLIREEAFYQRGFLTQRFIPTPAAEQLLTRYFDNTLKFLTYARCHIAEVRHDDDYSELFAEFQRQLETG